LLAIRLKRIGQKHRPVYRLVVSDSRNRTTGSNVEEVGTYDPKTDPSTIRVDMERVDYWLSVGARPSSQVSHLIQIAKKQVRAAEPTA
jgi:small subunit ribosomal protein S16